jgi:hypothetical protein
MTTMRPFLGHRALFALLLPLSLGCAPQDLSIGWEDLGGSDATVRNDASNIGDASHTSDASGDAGNIGDVSNVGDASNIGDVSNIGDAGDAGRFALVWRDDFKTLDPGRWELAEHTFEENYADFSAANAVTDGEFLRLGVRVKPAGSSGKPYTAAEVRTWAEVTCGKFLVRARIAPGFGIASTFFGFYDFFQNPSAQDWNEIVMESSAPSRIDYIYTLENPSLPGGKERVPSSGAVRFDATADFHVYGFEWTPSEVRFLVDGIAEQSLPAPIAARLNLPKRVVMSAYPSTRLAPNRTFDPAVLPAEAWFDWIEVYRYLGSCPSGAEGGTDASAVTDAGEAGG